MVMAVGFRFLFPMMCSLPIFWSLFLTMQFLTRFGLSFQQYCADYAVNYTAGIIHQRRSTQHRPFSGALSLSQYGVKVWLHLGFWSDERLEPEFACKIMSKLASFETTTLCISKDSDHPDQSGYHQDDAVKWFSLFSLIWFPLLCDRLYFCCTVFHRLCWAARWGAVTSASIWSTWSFVVEVLISSYRNCE